MALASHIEELMTEPERLKEMAKRSKDLGRPNAARDIALSILRLCSRDCGVVPRVRKMEGEKIKGHV